MVVMMEEILLAESLEKLYGKGERALHAVRGVSFAVAEGEIYGLLGPNGAGKSTTILMLATLIAPSAGRAWIAGYDVVREASQARRAMGCALQEVGVDPVLSGRELLILHARLYGMGASAARARAAEVLELVGLCDAAQRRIGTYSGGMRRRLDLGLALVHRPRLVMLDEPTTGLDPASRRDLWSEIRSLREQGTTVLLSTQYLEEAERLADRVAILAEGRIIAQDSPAALIGRVGRELVELVFASEPLAAQAAAALGADADAQGAHVRVRAQDAAAALPRLLARLAAQGLSALRVSVQQPTLEDVFLQLTGPGASQGPAQSTPAVGSTPRGDRTAREVNT
jgi:ABC-2 type transport system ATP-binding protein